MVAVVQRATSGQVTVGGELVGRIGRGLVVMVAVERDDDEAQAIWMAAKLAALRDQGALTEHEFAAKKAELLGRI